MLLGRPAGRAGYSRLGAEVVWGARNLEALEPKRFRQTTRLHQTQRQLLAAAHSSFKLHGSVTAALLGRALFGRAGRGGQHL